jgi:hypothetical protein
MQKSLIITTVAFAFLSLGMLVSAQAGGATSAPSKYARVVQERHHHPVQTVGIRITEFSSSSARSSASKR